MNFIKLHAGPKKIEKNRRKIAKNHTQDANQDNK